MLDAVIRTVLHHSEAADPTLVRWIRDEIDHLLGLPAEAYVALLGGVTIAFPLALFWLAQRRRHVLSGGVHRDLPEA